MDDATWQQRQFCYCALQVDVDAVDFGLVAFGFRYAKEFTLTNTCAIPMQYAWRVPKDGLDPAHKEFTVSSAKTI